MKNETAPLNIYLFRNPMESTEWAALSGSKYAQALPFPLRFVDSPEKAQVIVWDGQLSDKLRHRAEKVRAMVAGKILITNGALPGDEMECESVILPGVFNRPEELLSVLSGIYERVPHV